MEFKIVIRKAFERKFEDTVDYIGEHFGEKAALKFIKDLESKTERLLENPELGRPSLRMKEVRKIKVGKHNLVFYTLKFNKIVLLDLFNQRQNLSKSKY